MTTDVDGSVEVQSDVVKFADELLSLVSLLGQRLTAGHGLRPDPAVKLGLSCPANITGQKLGTQSSKSYHNFLTLDNPSCPRLASWTEILPVVSGEEGVGGVC